MEFLLMSSLIFFRSASRCLYFSFINFAFSSLFFSLRASSIFFLLNYVSSFLIISSKILAFLSSNYAFCWALASAIVKLTLPHCFLSERIGRLLQISLLVVPELGFPSGLVAARANKAVATTVANKSF